MPSQSNQTKRSAPVPATSGKSSNTKSSKGNSKSLRNSPGDKHNPNHPQHAAPILDATKASKKVAKAVRSTTKASKSKSGKTKKDKVGDGPEAELSEDEEALVVESDEADDDTTPEPEERALANGQGGVGTASGPKEISMHTLIAGAKPKDDHKISRGYEFVQSPASRLIIPADSTLQHLPSRLRGRDRGDSISSAFSDEGWEEVQFEMDVDAFGDEEMSLSTKDLAAHKRGYAEVVRGSFAPLVNASA